MHKKLKWNAIGLQSKTKILQEKISEEKSNEPSENLKALRKIQLFLDELNHLLEIIERIQKELIPNLENILRLKFKTPELIMLALARPSIRNIFENLEIYFKNKESNPLKIDEYKGLASSGDAGEVLALIGDSVLDLGVVQLLWDSSLATVGKLTQKRIELVSNENLAKICEKWSLYDYRLKRLNEPSNELVKPERINHEKGTLIEAIFGVIYLEFGLEESLRILPLIQ